MYFLPWLFPNTDQLLQVNLSALNTTLSVLVRSNMHYIAPESILSLLAVSPHGWPASSTYVFPTESVTSFQRSCHWPLERRVSILHISWRLKVREGVGAFLSVKNLLEGNKLDLDAGNLCPLRVLPHSGHVWVMSNSPYHCPTFNTGCEQELQIKVTLSIQKWRYHRHWPIGNILFMLCQSAWNV